MAAFQFPQNPDNGQTETNPATGITYVFVALPSPGKWEVQMRDSDGDFVNVTGDTMTGALNILPTNPIPAATGDSTLLLQSSPFSAFAENQNYVSRVLEAKTNQGHNIFSVRDSDATNLPILQGRISAISMYAADTLVQPTLNSITADDFPVAGLRSGFRIGGRVQGGANGDVLTCTYFASEGTQLDYYGDMNTETSIITKKYVDDTSVENSLIHGGTIAEGDEGSISGSGNLAVQRSSTAKGGNFYIRTSSSGNLIALEQPGKLSLTPNAAVADGIINLTAVYDDSGADNYAVKLNYKDNVNRVNELLTINATDRLLEYTGDVTVAGDLTLQTDAAVPDVNLTLTNDGDITTVGIVKIQNAGSQFLKYRGTDGTRDFVIYGSSYTNPTKEDDVLFGTYRNTLSNATQSDAIAYFGKTDGADNIQTNTSVKGLIGTELAAGTLPASLTNVTATNLTVTNKIGGTSDHKTGTLEIKANIVDVGTGSGGRLGLPAYINATQNFSGSGGPTIGLGTTNTLYFRNDSGTGGINGIGYLNNTGLVWNRQILMYGSSNGSDNPLDTSNNAALNFGGTGRDCFISKTGGTGTGADAGDMIRFFVGGTQSNKEAMNIFYNGSNVIVNCRVAPTTPYSVVRLTDLSSGVVGSVNTYSTSGVEGTSNYTVHINNHIIPGQCSFEGLSGGGAGFNLTGRSAAAPTNPSALLLKTTHYASDAAQIEYFGDTTGTDDCLQTKASVTALINASSGGIDDSTSSTLYGDTRILATSGGTAPAFKIRNAGDTANVFSVSNNGVVNLTNSLNGVHSINMEGNIVSTTGQFSLTAEGTNTALQFWIYDSGSSLKRLVYADQNSWIHYGNVSISGSLNVSNSSGITTSGPLQSTDNTPSGGIILNSNQTTSAVTVLGSSTKNFKIYVGLNDNNKKQTFMCSKSQMYFGNGNEAMDYKFTSSDSTIPLKFNDGVSFVLGSGADPITFTQNKIANVNTITPTGTDLALMFNNTANGPTFSQGTVENINYIKASSGTTPMYLQALGGTSQQIIFQTTTSSGDSYNTAVFDDAHAKLPGELDIYQNSGSTNGKIYSYGFSRGLDFYVADYNTAKGNSKLTARFQASMVSFMTGICFDNTSAYGNNPNTDITIRVGTGAQGSAAAYPKIDFAWATDTGVTYEHNFTMEYTQFTNVPDVVLLSGSRVTQASAPSNGNHLCNKTYVDNKTSSLQSTLHAAVNSSTDFASLKAALLAALA